MFEWRGESLVSDEVSRSKESLFEIGVCSRIRATSLLEDKMAVDKAKFLAVFEEALETDAGTIKGDEVLYDLEEWDSLAAITLIAGIDQLYNVTLPPNGIEEAKTVNDLFALASELVAAGH